MSVDDCDDLLGEALAEWLELTEQHTAPDEAAFLARHPELSRELRKHLDNWRRFQVPDYSVIQRRSSDTNPAAYPLDSSIAVPGHDLLGEIGRGGMGIVFRARNRSLNRVVALKMFPAHAGDPDTLQRFRNEPGYVARLDHPNVVPVYECGESEGIPFFTMKLVEGGNLASRLGTLLSQPAVVARCVAAIARGVQHAHERGILHRDLKPANVLLEPDGTPLVSDFGLARSATAQPELTRNGVIGTPAYLAPEAATGEPFTTASDIYGVGAILYATLTGSPPFTGETIYETLLRVRDADPVAPRQRNPLVPRDLEAVCLKCLAKEPARRYASAAELADDLDRWLRGEPVLARPVGMLARCLRLARRNKLAAGLASSLVLLVLAAVGGLTWGYLSLASQKDQTDQALKAERTQRKLLEQNLTLTLQAVHGGNRSTPEGWTQRPMPEEHVSRPVLERLVHLFESFAAGNEPSAELVRQAARAYDRLGFILLHDGHTDQAGVSFRRALQLYAALGLGGSAFPEDRVGRLTTHHGMVLVLREKRHFAEARRHLETQTALLNEMESDPGLGKQLPGWRGVVELNRGQLASDENNPVAAEAAYRRAVRWCEPVVKAGQGDRESRNTLAVGYSRLAKLRSEKHAYSEADALYEQALALLGPLVAQGLAAHHSLMLYSTLLGRCRNALAHRDEALAEKCARQLVDAIDQLPDARRSRGTHAEYLAEGLTQWATVLRQTGRADEADRLDRRALPLWQTLARENGNKAVFANRVRMVAERLGDKKP